MTIPEHRSGIIHVLIATYLTAQVVGEESGSFLEKRTKKLFLIWAGGGFTSAGQNQSKFFCFFLYTKRSAFLLLR
jgi:hypothetical protein